MTSNPVPYMLLSQTLDLEDHGPAKVYVCINLLDHRAVGVALTREAALEAMSQCFARLNTGHQQVDAGSFGASPN